MRAESRRSAVVTAFDTDYAAITLEELQKLAKTYLINAKAAGVIILPKARE